MIKRISLRAKITVLITILIIGISAVLTVLSINNANDYFVKFVSNTSADLDVNVIKSNNTVSDSESNMKVINDLIGEDNEKVQYIENETGNEKIDITVSEVSTQFANKSLIYMALIIIIGIIITYYILGKSLKPLKQLNNTIQTINENNLSNRVEVKYYDEVGSLADSFNIMLDRLNKSFLSQKQFASNAAHELKTPLAIMKSSIDVLRLDSEPTLEDYKENLEYIDESTKSLIKIVDGLLKLTNSNREEKNEIVIIEEIFQDIIVKLDSIIKMKNIQVSVKNDGYKILGDKDLLYHVFFNIVENAIKYNINNGKISIIVSEDNEQIKISITDTGIGIAKNEIENIFEAFYCVDKSRSEDNGGYGLGLSIVKSIIEKQNGKISVFSEINEGSTFELLFPKVSYQ